MKSSPFFSLKWVVLLLALAPYARAADEPVESAPVPAMPAMPKPAITAPTPAPAATPAKPALTGFETSVVKIFSTVRAPDLFRPWTKQPAREATASGVVIDGNRILTNAHAVLYASQVQIQAFQAGDKIAADVVAIAPGIDLAVLKVDDKDFFTTHPALARSAALPAIKDNVMAYGYPIGGTELSITKGIVSRIEFTGYSADTSGLRVQIDAAINAGNSGGPVIAGDKMIGIAQSIATGAQNIGYIIPTEEIEIFLQDIADGHYDGKPQIYDETVSLENPALRASLGLPPGTEGTYVEKLDNPSTADPLQPGDVITRIGGTPIDNEGKIKLGENRVAFRYLLQKLTRDGKAPLTIIRGGKEMTVSYPVEYRRPKLIPYLNGTYPPYFVYGPLVFTPATEDYVLILSAASVARNRANPLALFHGLTMMASPLLTQRGDRPTANQQELVLIPGPFLPHKLNLGYAPPVTRIVKSVDGIPIQSLRQLVEVLRDGKSEFVKIQFAERVTQTLVFRRQEIVAATDEVLNDNGIRSQASPELLKVWQAGR